MEGVALVFGAGAGIGREVAASLAERGVKTLVCADLSLDAARETVALCETRRKAATGCEAALGIDAAQVDVRVPESVEDVVGKVAARYGRIDYFVHAAGRGPSARKPLSEMTPAEYCEENDLHNVGAFLCIRSVVRTMRQQKVRAFTVPGRIATPSSSRSPYRLGCGSIVILSSLASQGAVREVGGYTAAKHAVEGLVKTAALENASSHIRINAVAPTFVATEPVKAAMKESPEFKAAVKGTLAAGRLAEPEEVADTIVFLASAAASYINGQTLVLDGGPSG